MSITFQSKFTAKRKQIIRIARKFTSTLSAPASIDGKKYKLHMKQGIVYIRPLYTYSTINSEMSYDGLKSNSFNLALNLAIRVKIAMNVLIKGMK